MIDEFECYLVGGAIRDRLLGRTPGDNDWVVVGSTPEAMLQLGFLSVGKHFPVFLHPETKEEYALARKEIKTGFGHKGFDFDVNPMISLEDDLSRRDLTINAIAESQDGLLIDSVKGLEDLKNKVLRHISEAFSEDPLRVFRVARFAGELLDFSIAHETQNMMTMMAQRGDLKELSPERVWSEFIKGLGSVDPIKFLRVMHETGALKDWLPELIDLEFEFTEGDEIDRFCELGLSSESFKDLSQRLRAPKTYQLASKYWARHHLVFEKWPNVEHKAFYESLEAMKCFHDMKHVDRLLGLARRRGADETGFLKEIVKKLIRLQIPHEEHLSGSSLGAYIKEHRIDWLKRQF